VRLGPVGTLRTAAVHHRVAAGTTMAFLTAVACPAKTMCEAAAYYQNKTGRYLRVGLGATLQTEPYQCSITTVRCSKNPPVGTRGRCRWPTRLSRLLFT
jgi:hypothetical protein